MHIKYRSNSKKRYQNSSSSEEKVIAPRVEWAEFVKTGFMNGTAHTCVAHTTTAVVAHPPCRRSSYRKTPSIVFVEEAAITNSRVIMARSSSSSRAPVGEPCQREANLENKRKHYCKTRILAKVVSSRKHSDFMNAGGHIKNKKVLSAVKIVLYFTSLEETPNV